VMTAVMIVGTILAEISRPSCALVRKRIFPGKIELCVHLTRILLPAPNLLLCWRSGFGGAALAPAVSVSRHLDR